MERSRDLDGRRRSSGARAGPHGRSTGPPRWIWLSLAAFCIPVVCASLVREPGEAGERERIAAPELAGRHEPPPARPSLDAPGSLGLPRTDVAALDPGSLAASPRAPLPQSSGPRTSGASETARLLARVLDLDRQPAREAVLELRHTSAGGERLERIALDASGCWRTELAPGEVCVSAWDPGATAGPLQRELAGGSWTELELVLVPSRSVAGVVLDALDGRPIAGARVSFWTFAESDREETAADGTFRHPRFPGGDFAHQVRVEAEGYGACVRYLEFPGERSWALPAACDGGAEQRGQGAPWLRLTLTPALAVRGRVVDASGAPLAGARVSAEGYFRILPAVASRDEAFGATDEHGRFALAGLRSDVGHALRVVVPGFAEQALELAADGARDVDVGTLVLRSQRSLAGVVLDPNGEPVADIAVELAPEEPGAASASGPLDVAVRVDGRKSTRTDAQGLFVFEGLASELYRVAVTRDRGALAEASVPADASEMLVLRLPPHTLTLEGEVRDERGLVAGAEVELQRFGLVGKVLSDAAGRFRIAGLDDEAAYRLVASAPAELGRSPRTGSADVWGYGSVHVRLDEPPRR